MKERLDVIGRMDIISLVVNGRLIICFFHFLAIPLLVEVLDEILY